MGRWARRQGAAVTQRWKEKLISREKNVTSKWKMNSGIRWNQKARKRVTGRQKERERNHQHIFPHMNAPYCISDIVF